MDATTLAGTILRWSDSSDAMEPASLFVLDDAVLDAASAKAKTLARALGAVEAELVTAGFPELPTARVVAFVLRYYARASGRASAFWPKLAMRLAGGIGRDHSKTVGRPMAWAERFRREFRESGVAGLRNESYVTAAAKEATLLVIEEWLRYNRILVHDWEHMQESARGCPAWEEDPDQSHYYDCTVYYIGENEVPSASASLTCVNQPFDDGHDAEVEGQLYREATRLFLRHEDGTWSDYLDGELQWPLPFVQAIRLLTGGDL